MTHVIACIYTAYILPKNMWSRASEYCSMCKLKKIDVRRCLCLFLTDAAQIAFPVIGALVGIVILGTIALMICLLAVKALHLCRGLQQPTATIIPSTPFVGSNVIQLQPTGTAVVPLQQLTTQQMGGRPQGQPSAPPPAVNSELGSAVAPPSYGSAIGYNPSYTPEQVYIIYNIATLYHKGLN